MSPKRPVLAVLAGLVVVAAVVAGCGSSAPSTAGGAPAPGNAVTISVSAFRPDAITVSAGTTITWTNEDPVAHTVTADDGSWDSGSLARGATFSHTFEAAGTYAYHCTIHPGMKGTVVVTP
jgi:plastocyanin